MKQLSNGLLALACLALVAAPAAAQAPSAASVSVPKPGYPRLTKLAPNVYGYEEMQSIDRGLFSTGVMFVVTKDGVLVTDGMGNPAATKEIVDEIAKITPKPIKWVVIGSNHGDHTGGDDAYPAGVTFYISPISKAILEKEEASPRFKPGSWKLPADAVLVPHEKVLDLGGEKVEIMFVGPGHTGGDLEIYLPKERIMATSEVYLNHVFPAMRSAVPTEWLATARKLLAMKQVRTYVPAHGRIIAGPQSRRDFEQFVTSMAYVIKDVTALHKKGLTLDQALKQVKWGPYASWPMSGPLGNVAVKRVYMELNGQFTK
ncbi:MAG TPA: MBL fold metallo-hydrolase [Vicinamibacterales bacterium]|nr:MBL fold metallo-hydrolase [Vicinamibacterales bacterium]